MANVLLISYDNDSHIPYFPMNLFYLAGALKHANHTVGIWLQDVHHGREEALTKILDENPFDIVGLGFVAGYYPYAKAKKISEAINRSRRRSKFIYILGGHGPAGEPDFFNGKLCSDCVVIGDGEKAILRIANKCKAGPADSGYSTCVIRGEPTEKDGSPLDCYSMFPMDIYKRIRYPTSNRTEFCMPILSSRGCKWKCSFCFRMREGFFERSVEAIVEEIKFLHKEYNITHFDFADELLMSSDKRTEEICESLLALPFKIKWDCNGRLNFAMKELLALMKKSGCEYVNYGIESLNQQILNQMGKGLTLDRIHQGVEDTLTSDLSPGLNILWPFPGDTIENLKNEVAFIKKYNPGHLVRTIRPPTPYPGCALWFQALEEGKVKNVEEFYENLHQNSELISINFSDIPTNEANRMLFEANRELYIDYLEKNKTKVVGEAEKVYLQGDYSFRGWRVV